MRFHLELCERLTIHENIYFIDIFQVATLFLEAVYNCNQLLVVDLLELFGGLD